MSTIPVTGSGKQFPTEKETSIKISKQLGGKSYLPVDMEFLKKKDPTNYAYYPIKIASLATFLTSYAVSTVAWSGQKVIPVFINELTFRAVGESVVDIATSVTQEAHTRTDLIATGVETAAEQLITKTDIVSSILSYVPIVGNIGNIGTSAVKGVGYAAKYGATATRFASKTNTSITLAKLETSLGIWKAMGSTLNTPFQFLTDKVLGGISYGTGVVAEGAKKYYKDPNATKFGKAWRGFKSYLPTGQKEEKIEFRTLQKGEKISKEEFLSCSLSDQLAILWISQHARRLPVGSTRANYESEIIDLAYALRAKRVLSKNEKLVVSQAKDIITRTCKDFSSLSHVDQNWLTPYEFAKFSPNEKRALIKFAFENGIPQKLGTEQNKVLAQMAKLLESEKAYPDSKSSTFDLPAIETLALIAFNQLPSNKQKELGCFSPQDLKQLSQEDRFALIEFLKSELPYTKMDLQKLEKDFDKLASFITENLPIKKQIQFKTLLDQKIDMIELPNDVINKIEEMAAPEIQALENSTLSAAEKSLKTRQILTQKLLDIRGSKPVSDSSKKQVETDKRVLDTVVLEDKISADLRTKGLVHGGISLAGKALGGSEYYLGETLSYLLNLGNSEYLSSVLSGLFNGTGFVLENFAGMELAQTAVTGLMSTFGCTEFATAASLKISEFAINASGTAGEYLLQSCQYLRNSEEGIWTNYLKPALENAKTMAASQFETARNDALKGAFDAYANKFKDDFGISLSTSFEDFKAKILDPCVKTIKIGAATLSASQQEEKILKAASTSLGSYLFQQTTVALEQAGKSAEVLIGKNLDIKTVDSLTSSWSGFLKSFLGSATLTTVSATENLREAARVQSKLSELALQGLQTGNKLQNKAQNAANRLMIGKPQEFAQNLKKQSLDKDGSWLGWKGASWGLWGTGVVIDIVTSKFLIKSLTRSLGRMVHAIGPRVAEGAPLFFSALSQASSQLGQTLSEETNDLFDFAGYHTESLTRLVHRQLLPASAVDPLRVERFTKDLTKDERTHLVELAIITNKLSKSETKELLDSKTTPDRVARLCLVVFDSLGRDRSFVGTPTALKNNETLRKTILKALGDKAKDSNGNVLHDLELCKRYWALDPKLKQKITSMTIQDYFLLSDKERSDLLYTVCNMQSYQNELNIPDSWNWFKQYEQVKTKPKREDIELILKHQKDITIEDRRILQPSTLEKFGLEKAQEIYTLLKNNNYIDNLSLDEKRTLFPLLSDKEKNALFPKLSEEGQKIVKPLLSETTKTTSPMAREMQKKAYGLLCYLFNNATDIDNKERISFLDCSENWFLSLGETEQKLLSHLLSEDKPLTEPSEIIKAFQAKDTPKKIELYNAIFSQRAVGNLLLGEIKSYEKREAECFEKLQKLPSNQNLEERMVECRVIAKNLRALYDSLIRGIDPTTKVEKPVPKEKKVDLESNTDYLHMVQYFIESLPENERVRAIQEKIRLNAEDKKTDPSYLKQETLLLNKLLKEYQLQEATLQKVAPKAPKSELSLITKINIQISSFFKGLFTYTMGTFSFWNNQIAALLASEKNIAWHPLDSSQSMVFSWKDEKGIDHLEKFHLKTGLTGATMLVSELSGATFASPKHVVEHLLNHTISPPVPQGKESIAADVKTSYLKIRAVLKPGQGTLIRKIGERIIFEPKPTSAIMRLLGRIKRWFKPAEYNLKQNQGALKTILDSNSQVFNPHELEELEQLAGAAQTIDNRISILQTAAPYRHAQTERTIKEICQWIHTNPQNNESPTLLKRLELADDALQHIDEYRKLPINEFMYQTLNKLETDIELFLRSTSYSLKELHSGLEVDESCLHHNWKLFEQTVLEQTEAAATDKTARYEIKSTISRLDEAKSSTPQIESLRLLMRNQMVTTLKGLEEDKRLTPQGKERIALAESYCTSQKELKEIEKIFNSFETHRSSYIHALQNPPTVAHGKLEYTTKINEALNELTLKEKELNDHFRNFKNTIKTATAHPNFVECLQSAPRPTNNYFKELLSIDALEKMVESRKEGVEKLGELAKKLKLSIDPSHFSTLRESNRPSELMNALKPIASSWQRYREEEVIGDMTAIEKIDYFDKELKKNPSDHTNEAGLKRLAILQTSSRFDVAQESILETISELEKKKESTITLDEISSLVNSSQLLTQLYSDTVMIKNAKIEPSLYCSTLANLASGLIDLAPLPPENKSHMNSAIILGLRLSFLPSEKANTQEQIRTFIKFLKTALAPITNWEKIQLGVPSVTYETENTKPLGSLIKELETLYRVEEKGNIQNKNIFTIHSHVEKILTTCWDRQVSTAIFNKLHALIQSTSLSEEVIIKWARQSHELLNITVNDPEWKIADINKLREETQEPSDIKKLNEEEIKYRSEILSTLIKETYK